MTIDHAVGSQMFHVKCFMLWIYLALFAYFLNALSFIVDKYLLSAPIPRPAVYAFWVGILSSGALLLIPLGVFVPGIFELLIAWACGAAFLTGLIYFYRSVKHGDVAVSATNTGVFSAFFSSVLAYLLLGQELTRGNLTGYVLLLAGLVLLALGARKMLIQSVSAGFFFALSYVLLKLTFNNFSPHVPALQGLINGIFWTRMGFVLSALLMLAVPSVRKVISGSYSETASGSKVIFVLNKLLIGTGFILLYAAIQQGDVAIVNALIGFQFAFVLILTVLIRRYRPGLIPEAQKRVPPGKIAGILLIGAGFLVLLF